MSTTMGARGADVMSARELTFGTDRQSRAPIGTDDRQRVTRTAEYPYRAIAHLSITPPGGGNAVVGTGFFLGPRLIVTAGHCVFFRGSPFGWAQQIVVTPGADGAAEPFGAIVSAKFQSNSNWTDHGLDGSDYGAIILNRDLGNQTGTIAMEPVTGTPAAEFELAGYPTFQPRVLGIPAAKTMWNHTGPVTNANVDSLFTTIDTSPGQSGSPLLLRRSDLPVAVGILVEPQVGANRVIRLTPEMREHLAGWLRM